MVIVIVTAGEGEQEELAVSRSRRKLPLQAGGEREDIVPSRKRDTRDAHI